MTAEENLKWLEQVRDWPHLIGHLCGKTKLTDIHSDWIKLLWDAPPEENVVALQSHRGAYKTTACTEVGIMYDLLFHPNHRIALIRETFTEASNTLEAIKKYMRLEPVRALFAIAHGAPPEEVTSREGEVTYSFKRYVTKEPSIHAYGINQVPTGSHFDRILCDDIITINSRLSNANRERVKLGLTEIITNIIDPGNNVLLVGTPWHRDDAWHTKNADGEPIVPEPYKYLPEDTGILTPEELEVKRKATTFALFRINYYLDDSVKDEGQIFEEPRYDRFDLTLPSRHYHAHIDAAWNGACTNAATVMYRNPATGKIHAWGRMYVGNIIDLKTRINEDIRAHCARVLHMETNPDKGMTAREFRSLPGAPVVLQYHESMNKDHKIITYLKKVWRDIYWAEDTDPNYIMQILDYREGQDPRDCADSAASCYREAFYPTEKGMAHSALWEM